jgi:AcrR family transcriptional regulator
MTTTRGEQLLKQGEQTKEAILEAGLELWPDVTPSTIAAKLGITHAAVLYHFPNVKEAVAQYAVDNDCSKVIVQMLATNHKLVKDMPAAERLRHFTAI